eukprot:scaffold85715_cov50-Cyclotella_meneghiniana.AAC.2
MGHGDAEMVSSGSLFMTLDNEKKESGDTHQMMSDVSSRRHQESVGLLVISFLLFQLFVQLGGCVASGWRCLRFAIAIDDDGVTTYCYVLSN